MAKKKVKKTAPVQHNIVQQPVITQEIEDEMFDFSNPDDFRKAFIASEILNRKY